MNDHDQAAMESVRASIRDLYRPVAPGPETIAACPVCGAEAVAWSYSSTPAAPMQRVVMCSNGEAFGPQEGFANEGCLLFMPPDEFYKATIREAVRFWNEYAEALVSLRAARSNASGAAAP